MKSKKILWLLAGCLLAVPASAQITLDAAKDNTLYEDATGSLSNGVGPSLFTGNTVSNGVRRGLIAFDIAGAIPAGAIVTDVQLSLTMNMSIAGPQDVSIHRLSADWGEGTSDAGNPGGGGASATTGDATWLHTFFDTDFWTTPGGDFNATPSATQSVDGAGAYAWGSTPEMVADVQSWLDDPAGNYGWIVIGNESATATAKRFGSRESAEAPQLTITFIEPPLVEVPTLSEKLLAGLALILLVSGVFFLRRR